MAGVKNAQNTNVAVMMENHVRVINATSLKCYKLMEHVKLVSHLQEHLMIESRVFQNSVMIDKNFYLMESAVIVEHLQENKEMVRLVGLISALNNKHT